MITEPEMADESGQDGPGDVLSHSDGSPQGSGYARRRPWMWALGGIVAASAIWAAALRGTDYGHTAAPDLHGYHLEDSPCTSQNLRPLTDDLAAGQNNADTSAVHIGKTLDYVVCHLYAQVADGDGWITSYTISVSVALHKKADPRAEFEDATQVLVADPNAVLFGGSVYLPHKLQSTKPFPGLGDRAYVTSGAMRQSLDVLHGGAVFSLSLEGSNNWQGEGQPPTTADGAPKRPAIVDTTKLRPALPTTMRHLMKALSSPQT